MNKIGLLLLIDRIADKIIENRQYLTELDSEIGDADHGVNMARGFTSIKNKLGEFETLSVGEILVSIGKTLIKDVAGSSGPLYGSAFKASGKYIGDRDDITINDFTEMLRVSAEKIHSLGMAVEGEKTMLDAIYPALRALEGKNNAKAALKAASDAADAAAEHTKDYVATKGRASYVGERSLGHKDPGAVSFAIILATIADFSGEN